ncbi:hypothetical protein [Seonamhaeicola maritimus]|uniref:Uncharacterized protein n=1 Tax=Seonamhaeicola maritimus TaxID=2591822 RepID=A0A5C7GK69_9FLAO|nr:hypothetical protein [Seonamhaeicola maritimus]TXG38684.1 hypothetical protein FUA22_02025 [Seonamhaeicola maritimus]
MQTVLTEQDFEPEGILNSSYKRLVKSNFYNKNSRSIFGIKQRIKSHRYQFTSGIATALKVCAFTTMLIVIFS